MLEVPRKDVRFMKQSKYDKQTVIGLALAIFVISTVIVIFSFTNPLAVVSMVSGLTFGILFLSDMLE
jgi:hypothetical protein